MVSIKTIDDNGAEKRILLTLDAGDKSTITVQELYSRFVDQLQKQHAVHIDNPAEISGVDEINPVSDSGAVVLIDNDWFLDTEDAGLRHRMELTQGIWKHRDGSDPLLGGTNVIWSLGEFTVSAVFNLETLETNQTNTEAKIDIIDTNVDTTLTDLATVDGNVDLIKALVGNDQEWISPGLLKVYDASGKVGGTTLAEFETRTTGGVQTFVLADVKQYIRTK